MTSTGLILVVKHTRWIRRASAIISLNDTKYLNVVWSDEPSYHCLLSPRTDNETSQAKRWRTRSLQVKEYNVCWYSQCTVWLINHKWQTVGYALDSGSLSCCGMSLDKPNHTGIGASFHHIIACWCDNQAQSDGKWQAASYTCVHVYVCKTHGGKENKLDFLCIRKICLVWHQWDGNPYWCTYLIIPAAEACLKRVSRKEQQTTWSFPGELLRNSLCFCKDKTKWTQWSESTGDTGEACAAAAFPAPLQLG